jgi:hypothetical protein
MLNPRATCVDTYVPAIFEPVQRHAMVCGAPSLVARMTFEARKIARGPAVQISIQKRLQPHLPSISAYCASLLMEENLLGTRIRLPQTVTRERVMKTRGGVRRHRSWPQVLPASVGPSPLERLPPKGTSVCLFAIVCSGRAALLPPMAPRVARNVPLYAPNTTSLYSPNPGFDRYAHAPLGSPACGGDERYNLRPLPP